MERADRDAVAEADRHRPIGPQSRARGQASAALAQLDLDLVEEAHLARNACCRVAPTWSAICAVPMLELSFMISATEQARPNGCVSWIDRPRRAARCGQLYIWPKL